MATRPTQEDIAHTFALYERLLQRRAPYERMWHAIASLMRPTRIDIRQRRTPGAPQTYNIYDGTAIKAAHDLASALSGSMTPVEFPWFSLRMRLKELNDDYNVQMWLEECTQRIHLAFQQSNFGSEFHELYLDLITFGTGCVYIEERPLESNFFNGFQFHTVAPGRYVILEGPDGRVNEIFRTLKLTAKACAELWGRQGVSQKVRDLLDQQKGDTLVEILHHVYPHRNGTSAYYSCYYEFETKHHLATTTQRKFRFLVPRWTKSSDEEYGRGQGHVAFPDVASLNRAIEMRFKQWALAVDPPLVTLEGGVIGTIKRAPGTRINVRSRDALWELETHARFDVAQFSEKELRAAIRNYFFSDLLQLPAKPYMTAYEIQQQVEIMQRLLGPTIGRVKYELLAPLIDNAFDIMFHARALPPPPDTLVLLAQQAHVDIDVEYESPLTRSQRAADLVAIEKTVAAARPFIEMRPEVLDNFDADRVVRFCAEQAGVPTTLLKSEQDVVEERTARAQAQAELARLQAENVEADTLRKGATGLAKVAPFLKGGTGENT